MAGEMTGTRGHLLGLVARTTALTVATLGIYSFWGRTRVRRWIWSALSVGGMPFEYAGRPLEKLMGFVIAAVIVAVYLGIVVMLLVFASLNLTGDAAAGSAAAFALVIPVFWAAKYRGQRYLLNHTRWRGIAFSMSEGAWGYVLRATFWTLATLVTAGILLPVRTQRLWKFRVERTWFGDDHFRLAAAARDLYAPFAPVLATLWGTIVCAGAAVTGAPAAGLLLFVLVPGLLLSWVHWRVASFRILVSGIRFGGAVDLRVSPRTGAVIGIHLLGWFLMGLLLILAGVAIAFAFGFFAAGAGAQVDLGALESLSPYLLAAGAALFYLTFFILRGALRTAMVTYPLFQHVAGTLVVGNAIEVNAVRRGEPSHMADADGFANLFDMGSGI